jgi:hypothetical protein
VHINRSRVDAARLGANVRAAVADVRPDVVIVDSLTEYAAGRVRELSNAGEWTPVMRELRELARTTGAAVVLIHHAAKGTGSYRDSTAIGAGVDLILEMTGDEATADRKVRARGRWPVGDYAVRYEAGRGYVTPDLAAPPPVGADVYRRIVAAGASGISLGKLRESIGGARHSVDAAVRELEAAGRIRRGGRYARWLTTDPAQTRLDGSLAEAGDDV